MTKLEELRKKNDVPIHDIHGERYRSYGRIIENLDVKAITEYMENNTPIPEEGNIYVPSVEELEQFELHKKISDVFYGGMPVQFGYCNGRNNTYNGFEYHKGSEYNIAVTDFMLVLGHSWEIADDLTYSIDQADVFFVEKGTVFEMFETTLHLSPLRVSDEGFRDVIILPKGTNTPLTDEEKAERDEEFRNGNKEARLLLLRNKWVISHPEREPLMKQGAFPGVIGENKELYY